MREKIEKMIDYLESEIEFHEKRANAMVNELRECAAKYDTYSLVTFLPSKIEGVKYEVDMVREMREQKRMLVHFLKEDG